MNARELRVSSRRHYTPIGDVADCIARSPLSERMPAKLAVFMAARTVLACEMTITTSFAVCQRLVLAARVTSSLRHVVS